MEFITHHGILPPYIPATSFQCPSEIAICHGSIKVMFHRNSTADRWIVPKDATVCARFAPHGCRKQTPCERGTAFPFLVLETHCSPNRRDRVGIVGIVIIQLSTVARVANANVVGIPGVRSPKQRNLQAPRSHVACSLNGFIEKFCIISPIGFQHPFREILRGCCQFCPKFTSVIGYFAFDVHGINTGTERI